MALCSLEGGMLGSKAAVTQVWGVTQLHWTFPELTSDCKSGYSCKQLSC